jgi:hypothetical protein
MARHIHKQTFRPLVSSKSIPEAAFDHHIGIEMCLETQKGPDLKEDKENLTLLRSLIEGQRRARSSDRHPHLCPLPKEGEEDSLIQFSVSELRAFSFGSSPVLRERVRA